jgi:hypothetical protein
MLFLTRRRQLAGRRQTMPVFAITPIDCFSSLAGRAWRAASISSPSHIAATTPRLAVYQPPPEPAPSGQFGGCPNDVIVGVVPAARLFPLVAQSFEKRHESMTRSCKVLTVADNRRNLCAGRCGAFSSLRSSRVSILCEIGGLQSPS